MPNAQNQSALSLAGVILNALGPKLTAAVKFIDSASELQEDQAESVEVVTPLPPSPSVDDPALNAIQGVVDHINNGSDLNAHYGEIRRLTHGQDSKAELIASLSQTHDYTRLAAFLKARKALEAKLLDLCQKDGLSAGEQFALLQYLGENIKETSARVAANSTSGKDVASMLAKIDFALTSADSAASKKLEGTTPQNREVVRRISFKLSRMLRKR